MPDAVPAKIPVPPKPECFYRMREDGLIERVDPTSGRVVAVLSDWNKENDIQHFVATIIDGQDVLVQVGITTPIGVTKACPYSPALADIICQKIIEDTALSDICRLPGFPTLSMLARWRKENSDFDEMIRYARKVRAERLRDIALSLAFEAVQGTKDDVPGKKLAVETLQWAAEKDSPEEYGSKLKVEGSALVALVVDTGIRRTGDPGAPPLEEKNVSPKEEVKNEEPDIAKILE